QRPAEQRRRRASGGVPRALPHHPQDEQQRPRHHLAVRQAGSGGGQGPLGEDRGRHEGVVTPATPRTDLARTLGLRDLVMITVGTVIGSGIFVVPAETLRESGGSAGLALSVWVVG